MTCTCTTGHSSILAWSSDQLIGQDGTRLEFTSLQPLLMRQDASGSNTSAVLTDNSDFNGVVVLKSNLTFVVPLGSPAILMTCSGQSPYSIIIPFSSKIFELHTCTI